MHAFFHFFSHADFFPQNLIKLNIWKSPSPIPKYQI